MQKESPALIIHREELVADALAALRRTPPIVRTGAGTGDLLLLTFSNFSGQTPLELSLEILGVDSLIVLGKELGEWPGNRIKIQLAHDYLMSLKTLPKYTMWIDSRDAVFVDNPERAIRILADSECELLCSSTAWFYPDCPELKARLERLAEGSPNPFLNSGALIGKTQYLIGFLAEALAYQGPAISAAYPTSDQALFSALFPGRFPEVKIDYLQRLAYRPRVGGCGMGMRD